MDFFKKKERDESEERKNLPELPDNSSALMLPDLPPLPALPRTRAGDAMNLSAIKGSVSTEMPAKPSARAIELPEEEEMSSSRSFPPSESSRTSGMKEPVFIRIDKFREAVKKFGDIKTKVEEIEEALQKIRAIKEDEERELKSWEEDVRNIKEKVDSIETSLFSKI